jgi:hypothetical protein
VTVPLYDNPPDTEPPDAPDYRDEPEPDRDDWTVIIGADDYATLIRPKSTAVSREYRDKTYSMLKSLVIGCINVGDMEDAATLLRYGPSFGIAVGQLANQDEKARHAIDWLTKPGNPYMSFTLTGLSMVSQLVRNHEKALSEIPNTIKMSRRERKAMRAAKKAEPPRFTIRLLGREIPVRMNFPRLKNSLGLLRVQTTVPHDLVNQVFSDRKLLNALEDSGVILIKKEHNDQMPSQP